jgi:hypothetical protein
MTGLNRHMALEADSGECFRVQRPEAIIQRTVGLRDGRLMQCMAMKGASSKRRSFYLRGVKGAESDPAFDLELPRIVGVMAFLSWPKASCVATKFQPWHDRGFVATAKSEPPQSGADKRANKGQFPCQGDAAEAGRHGAKN